MKSTFDKKLGRSLKDLTNIRLNPLENVVSLKEQLEFAKPKAKAQVYCIASGKGGTGKTFFTTNLGLELSSLGLNTLIIDADFSLSNAHLLLGLTPQYDISHFLCGQKTLDEIIIPGNENLQLLPGASGSSELSALSFRKFGELLDSLIEIEHKFDIILIDLAAGISPQIMNFLIATEELIVVINPDISSMMDAYAMIKNLYQYKKNLEIKFLINKVKTKEEGIFTYNKINNIIQNFLPKAWTSLIGVISQNHYVLDSIYKRNPVICSHPYCKTTTSLKKITEKISQEQKKWKKGLDKTNSISYFYKLKEHIL